jgi:hypothetical protein
VILSLPDHPPLVLLLFDGKFPLVLKAKEQHFLLVLAPIGLQV